MSVFCYICRDCGKREEVESGAAVPMCGGFLMNRDYKAERVGVQVVQLQRDREANGTKGYQELFLPTNKDFAGPNDPDGTKGMRDWRERHAPSDGNKHPKWPGEVERKVTGGVDVNPR